MMRTSVSEAAKDGLGCRSVHASPPPAAAPRAGLRATPPHGRQSWRFAAPCCSTRTRRRKARASACRAHALPSHTRCAGLLLNEDRRELKDSSSICTACHVSREA